ncbi:MAG TPA: alpha/beta hydrolase, partial [Euzebya sp.]|nr:alpha/beta hydrolase [Euzebya sp.]
HGGLVAQRAAWAMAHRIASMTLIGSGAGALGDDSREMVVRVATAAGTEGMAAAWRAAQGPVAQAPEQQGAPDSPVGEPRRATFERDRFMAMSPEAVIGGARNLVTAMPLGAFLRGIDFPVLVCHGDDDTTWLPHEQRLLARRIAGARYRVIPDAVHAPALENPEGLLAELLPFLESADPPTPLTRT